MRRTLSLVAMGAVAVLAGGCGDDDNDDAGAGTTVNEGGSTSGSAAGGDAQAYVDAMIESFDESDPDELQIDRDQAQCLAPRWVEIIQPERLAEAGIQPEDFAAEDEDVNLSDVGLSEADGNEMYDAFEECGIDVKDVFIGSLATDEDLSEDDAACLSDAMDDDLLRRIMVTSFVEGEEALDEDEELTSELVAAFSECPGIVDTTED